MNTTSNQATDSNGSISKTKTMTRQAQIDKSSETKSFTVRTGGRKLTYVFRPRKRLSILLKFLIGIFGGQVLIWPGMAAAQGLAPNALPTGGSIGAGAASVNTVGNAMSVNLNCGGKDSGPAGASGAVRRFECTATGLTAL